MMILVKRIQILIYTTVLLAIIASGLAGCASAKLKVTVDVYSEDARLGSLVSPDRIANIDASIREAEAGIVAVAKNRIGVARTEFGLYAVYFRLAQAINFEAAPPPVEGEQVSALRDQLDQHTEHVTKRSEIATRCASDAVTTLEQVAQLARLWRANSKMADGQDFLKADAKLELQLHALSLAIEELAIETTDFEQNMNIVFEETLDGVLAAANVAQVSNEAVQAIIVELTDELESAAEMLASDRLVSTDSVKRLRASSIKLSAALSDTRDATTIANQVKETVAVAKATTRFPGFRTAGQDIIRDIAIAGDFLASQLDRVQDPADPAWRIILDPANQANWYPLLSEVDYYAEGNTQVVIVQDRIGHFRVVRGQNDPSALIRSQAEISRSIASGAVSVLSAASGIAGVPGLSSVTNAMKRTGESNNVNTGTLDPVIFIDAAECARLEAESVRMGRNIDALINAISDIRNKISVTPGDIQSEDYQVIKQLIAAYTPVFTAPTASE